MLVGYNEARCVNNKVVMVDGECIYANTCVVCNGHNILTHIGKFVYLPIKFDILALTK